MANLNCSVRPATARDDPYEQGRDGFVVTMPYGLVAPPLALAIRHLPAGDWHFEPAGRRWWLAEEHLPVLRRFLADVDVAARRSA